MPPWHTAPRPPSPRCASLRTSIGWRIAFLVGPALAFVVIIFVRRNLPESPRWLITHGRVREAEQAIHRIEEEAIQAGQHLARSAGLAGRVIVETARQTHAQLVVLAAWTGMAVVPGTVSQYVLLKSHCPVTIVPHDGKDEERDDNQS